MLHKLLCCWLNAFDLQGKCTHVSPNKLSGNTLRIGFVEFSKSNVSEHLSGTLLSVQTASPGSTSVSAVGWRVNTIESTMSSTMSSTENQVHCMEIWWVMGSKQGWGPMLSNHAWYEHKTHKILWIQASACLMNVSRVHVGPINASSNVMKQLLHRGKWSVYLNRNVTMQ